jgi:hypothetical protein
MLIKTISPGTQSTDGSVLNTQTLVTAKISIYNSSGKFPENFSFLHKYEILTSSISLCLIVNFFIIQIFNGI